MDTFGNVSMVVNIPFILEPFTIELLKELLSLFRLRELDSKPDEERKFYNFLIENVILLPSYGHCMTTPCMTMF